MKRLVVCLIVLVVVAPLAAVPEPTADELQTNRRRVEWLRKHQPEQLDKLRGEAKEFFALPKERRKQIVEVHKELQKQTPAVRARLYQVLDRYVDWLDDDEARQEKVAKTTDRNKRLELLRDLREQEWTKDQPKAIQGKLAQLEGDARKAFIAKEKADERQRRFDWLIAKNFWNELEAEKGVRKGLLPTRAIELPQQAQSYLQNYLLKMFLNQEEKEQLSKLEGQWPQYPMKLVELADKHPPALPGPLGPKSFAELPPRVYANKEFLGPFAPKFFKKEQPPAALARLFNIKEGKWPEFGMDLAKAAKQRGHTFEHEFLAYNFDCLTPPMQEFFKKKLEPVLSEREFGLLNHAYNKWPDYPRTLQELANNHHLQPPWFTLPPGGNWENYRLPKMTALQ